MGSNDGVTVYQTDFVRCGCPECPSPVEAVEVANNLLLDNHDSRGLRSVSPKDFKPWYDCKNLVSLCFKFQPPKLSISCDNKVQTLPSESDHLLEFSPVYSGKSCVKTQLQRRSCNSSGSDSQEFCNEGPGPKRQCNHWSVLPRTGDDSSGKNKRPQEVVNCSAKSLWSASPYLSGKNRREKDLILEKFKETNLQQVKEKHRLNNHQRGKWIVKRNNLLKGKNLTVEQLWRKVRSLIKEGHLLHCNAKLQKTQDEVWVYCDFGHTLKVRSALEKALGNVGTFSFCVHPVGVVMEL